MSLKKVSLKKVTCEGVAKLRHFDCTETLLFWPRHRVAPVQTPCPAESVSSVI
jgi:hypothetical protein